MKTTTYKDSKKRSKVISTVNMKVKQNRCNNVNKTSNIAFNYMKGTEPVENGISKHIGGLKMFTGTGTKLVIGICERSSKQSKANVKTGTNKSFVIRNDGGHKLSSKSQHYDPTELMKTFENFSDVWNDCPEIKNPKNHENNILGGLSSQNVDQFYNGVDKHFKFTEEKNNQFTHNKSYHGKEVSVKLSHCKKECTNGSSYKNVEARHQKQEMNLNQSNSTLTNKQNNVAEALKIESNLKRQRAAEKKGKLYTDQKNIIKQALSSLDGEVKVNKKIVFSNSGEVEEKPKIKQSKKAYPLFNEDDESEPETNLKLNPQFEGKKGQKLLELQSKFANDSRFNLDPRFYESASSEESDVEKAVTDEQTNEKERYLAILETVVKHEVKPLSELKKKSGLKDTATLLLRFDPTRADHSKYIVNQPQKKPDANIAEKVKKKKRKKDELEGPQSIEQKPPPKVSDEKIFKIKEDFKESLKNESGTEFSLLKLFGSKVIDEDSLQEKKSKNITKPKYGMKNPFKYDSSESEEEKEETGKRETLKKQSVVSWQPTFFFSENDSRFQEGVEFLQGANEPEDTEEYAEKRKQLKDFIRHKLKNYNRKKSLFKTKLRWFKKGRVSKEERET